MNEGFFPESTTISVKKDDANTLPKCGACGFYKKCKSPKMPVYGNGRKKILIVGEFPEGRDDDKGKPFYGEAGARLRAELDELGVDLKEDCWSTNALICRPPGSGKSLAVNVQYCRPNLLKVIEQYKPRVIILLGYYACYSLISWLWRDKIGEELRTWLGWKIPSQQINAWVCPTYSPADVLFKKNSMVDWWFKDHLKDAVALAGKRPWKVVPDYASMVDVVTDTDEAAERLYEIIKLKSLTAADYEANGLKVEYSGFKILSCAVSVVGSNRALSFPFSGKVIKVLGEFWKDKKIPKAASNLKYEDRLTKWYYGFWPANWYLDTMLMAHFLNCRSGITSLKFQIFVRRGVGAYNDHIEPLLRGAEGRRLNDAEFTIDKRQLLQYGGEDSLYEGFVAEDQLKELKQR